MHRRFRDADHRSAGQLACRQQTRIAKAGNDVAADALRSAQFNLLQHADGGDRLIEVPFNGRHALRRRNSQNFGARCGDRTRGLTDSFGHRQAGIRVNNLNQAHEAAPEPAANSREKSGSVSPLRSKCRLETMCSK